MAALYMIHLLAQDYNKIRKTQAATAAAVVRSFFSKRDLTSENRTIRKVSYINLSSAMLSSKPPFNHQLFILLLKSNNMHGSTPIFIPIIINTLVKLKLPLLHVM